jgi:hypothetical protein
VDKNRSPFDPTLAIFFFATSILIAPLVVPSLCCDRAIWVSVAERLLAGDRLYSEVYDNKDPLFFYFLAGQRALGPWAQVGAEVLLVGIAAASSYLIAILSSSRWSATAVALIAVPIVVTGRFYLSGYAFLPATSLILVACAASAYGRPALAGVCVALLLFTKINVFPIGVAGVACFLLSRNRLAETITAVAVAFITLIAFVCVLLAREEFWPYVNVLRLNVAYAQGAVVGEKTGLALIAAHLASVYKPWVAAIFLANMVILAGMLILTLSSRISVVILTASIATLAASLLVFGLTGIFNHHDQMLATPAVFAVIDLAPFLDWAVEKGLSKIAVVGLAVVAAFILGGLPKPSKYVQSATSAGKSYSALGELPAEARRLLAVAPSGTYARFGTNDGQGHAYGLKNWKLACPRFHQYDFEPKWLLDTVFDCASAAPTLIVSETFGQHEPLREDAYGYSWRHSTKTWDDFVIRVERLLEQNYSCDARTDRLRICQRVKTGDEKR